MDTDNKRLLLAGGSTASVTNGAYIDVRGYDYGGTGSGGDIVLSPGNATGMYVDIDNTLYVKDSKVGIGTDNPNSALEVMEPGGVANNTTISAAMDAGITLNSGNTVDHSDFYPALSWFCGDGEVDADNKRAAAITVQATQNGSGSNQSGVNMRFYVHGTNETISGNNITAKMCILSNGRVGIGTDIPTSVLRLEKDLDDLGTTNPKNAGSHHLLIKGGSGETGDTASIAFATSDDVNVGALIMGIDAGTGSETDLEFWTDGAMRMHIDNDGKVGIGVTVPQDKLDIKPSATGTGLAFAMSDSMGPASITWYEGSGDIGTTYQCSIDGIIANGENNLNRRGQMAFYVNKSGTAENNKTLAMVIEGSSLDVYPGTGGTQDLGQPATRWEGVWITDSAISGSDRELKRDIEDSTLGLDFVKMLKPISYKWKDRDIEGWGKKEYKRRHYGLIAQDVKATLDDLEIDTVDFAGYIDGKSKTFTLEDGTVEKNGDDGPLSLRYTEFIAPMIKAIQELSAKVTALENNNNNKQGDSNEGSSETDSGGADSNGSEGSGVYQEPSSSVAGSSDESGDVAGSTSGDGADSFPKGEPSSEWTKAQLRAYMDANGINTANAGDTKSDLINKIGV